MDVAVIMATVDDPCAVFKTEVIKNGNKMPRPSNADVLAEVPADIGGRQHCPKGPAGPDDDQDAAGLFRRFL